MKKIGILLTAMMISGLLPAQNTEFDAALRYSQYFYGGTARFTSMGGAFTALGSDMSSISLNPAGLGVYSGLQIEVTPSLGYFQSNTNTIGYTQEDFEYNFNFHNLGLAAAFKPSGETRWENINIGFGYNQLNDYNQKNHARHINKDVSLLDEWVANTNAGTIGAAYEDLAWQTYLINYDSTFNEYFSTVVDALNYDTVPELRVKQRNTIDTKGSLGEYFFSVAGNYAHKFYIGASLGIQRINYELTRTHTEVEEDNNIYDFHSFDFTEYEDHSGTGFNFKLGAIYKPVEFLRIGASVQTPTFFKLEYNWYNTMNSNFDDGSSYSASSDIQTFSYRLSTPFRFNSGIALTSQKWGMISFDYERVDYEFMQLKEGDGGVQFTPENDSISMVFGAANNYRVGGELKLGQFYVRGGFALYESPYKSRYDERQSVREIYSGGFGYRENSFFVDFAFSRALWQEKTPIFSTLSDLTTSDFTQNKFIITAGFRF